MSQERQTGVRQATTSDVHLHYPMAGPIAVNRHLAFHFLDRGDGLFRGVVFLGPGQSDTRNQQQRDSHGILRNVTVENVLELYPVKADGVGAFFVPR
jgi:hypothetical protein